MVRTVCLDEEKHGVTMLRGLKQLKHEYDFCDFTIKVQDAEYRVHRNVIAVASPYFKAMLKHDTIESQKRLVKMEDVDAECVKNCVEFIYSGKFNIPDEKIAQFLHVAIMMQLEDVKQAICKLLKEELKDENFYETRNVAERYQLSGVLTKCKNYYEENLITISTQPGFQTETKSHLFNVLMSESLQLSEDDKLSVSLRWVGENNERKKDLLELIKHIKIEEVSTTYLSELLRNHPIIKNDLCLYKLLNDPLLSFFEKSSENDELFVLFDEDTDCLQSYNPLTNEVAKFHDEKFEHMKSFTAVGLESYIYILLENKSVFRLNVKDKNSKWQRMRDMIDNHGPSPPCVSFHGTLFVVGGVRTQVVENYNPAADQWLKLKNQPAYISLSICVSLDDSIYCIGGIDGYRCLDALCKFTPSSSRWIDLEPMKMARKRCGAVAVEQKIFVMGGYYDLNSTNDVDCYDVRLNQWTALSPMIKRHGLNMAYQLDGMIFSIPCVSSSTSSLSINLSSSTGIEKYDIANDKWSEVEILNASSFKVYKCSQIRY